MNEVHTHDTTAHRRAPRVLGLLVGAIHNRRSGAWVKYGQLFAELAARCARLDVLDLDLRGAAQYWGALTSLRASPEAWREAFRKSIWAYGQRSRRARREIRRRGGDVDAVLQHGALFHAHTPGGPPVIIYTDFTYRLAQREDAWRNPFTSPGASEHWNSLEHEAYHGAARVLTRSAYARQSLIDDYAVPPERVIVVGGGVNFAQLPQPSQPATRRVLFIGRDFERKGGGLLLAAFAQAREQVPEAELWMVTDRPASATPGVRWIPPTYNRAAIAALYRDADIFALPSQCETWGDVFLEAMAYGLPCIGANSDAMPEIIQHGETGLLVPPGDVKALVAALVTLLANEPLRRSLGACGRKRVEAAFTWTHVAERIVPYLTG